MTSSASQQPPPLTVFSGFQHHVSHIVQKVFGTTAQHDITVCPYCHEQSRKSQKVGLPLHLQPEAATSMHLTRFSLCIGMAQNSFHELDTLSMSEAYRYGFRCEVNRLLLHSLQHVAPTERILDQELRALQSRLHINNHLFLYVADGNTWSPSAELVNAMQAVTHTVFVWLVLVTSKGPPTAPLSEKKLFPYSYWKGQETRAPGVFWPLPASWRVCVLQFNASTSPLTTALLLQVWRTGRFRLTCGQLLRELEPLHPVLYTSHRCPLDKVFYGFSWH
jgi:hypothetical protein